MQSTRNGSTSEQFDNSEGPQNYFSMVTIPLGSLVTTWTVVSTGLNAWHVR